MTVSKNLHSLLIYTLILDWRTGRREWWGQGQMTTGVKAMLVRVYQSP